MNNLLTQIRTYLQAQICYQMAKTPICLPLQDDYKFYAYRSCEILEAHRSEVIHVNHPRHYVINRFKQVDNAYAPKILVTHGWMSRSAYMIKIILALHQQGYEVYAPDFPGHGEAKGLQLPWADTVSILRDIINQHGPFYAVVGHSYGGIMWLNTLNLSGQSSAFHLEEKPKKNVLIAAPIRMHNPFQKLARKLGLDSQAFFKLKHYLTNQDEIDVRKVSLNHFLEQKLTLPFLCLHGDNDPTVDLNESKIFCKKYPHASLDIIDKADHISVLMDDRVNSKIIAFLAGQSH